MKIKAVILNFLFTFFATHSFAQEGKELFQNNCAACHSIGKGRLVGPDLKDVDKKYLDAHLLKWIKSSQSVIKSGDKKAKALFHEYNEAIMPDQELSDAEIKSVIAYIKTESEAPVATANATSTEKPSSVQSTLVSSNGSTTNQVEQNTPKNSITDKPDSLFIKFGISLIAIFFLSIVWVLARVINTLSKALSEEYAKNKIKS